MQVTETQVQRSLEALRADDDAEVSPVQAEPVDAHRSDVPAGLVEQLTESPPIRSDRFEEARRRLETGEQLSAEDLAQHMVGRLVCDRLR